MVRFEEIPYDLDKFFYKMLEGITPTHHSHVALYFRCVLANRDRPSLLTFSFMEEEEREAENILVNKPAAGVQCQHKIKTRTPSALGRTTQEEEYGLHFVGTVV